jgi:predicted DNA-binding transcriptional regulator AlpA
MQKDNKQVHQQTVLFIKDVEQIIGRNRLTLRRWWEAEKFPKPTKLNGTVLAWHTNDIYQWIHRNLHNTLLKQPIQEEQHELGNYHE